MARRSLFITALVFALTAGVACTSSESGGDDATGLAAGGSAGTVVTDVEPGLDPFVVTDVTVPSDEIIATLREVAEASGAAVESAAVDDPVLRRNVGTSAAIEAALGLGLPDVVAPASPAGVGIYGGSGENVCDVAGIVAFFEQNEAEAAAWAGVHGIEVADITTYLQGLTPGRLLLDTAVTNHGFREGEARANNDVLAAGTAVLVDADGVPRVRCKCGNPLLSSDVEIEGRVIQAQQWADAVVDSSISEFSAEGTENPQNVIGPIDYESSGEALTSYTALGNAESECEFFVTVEFIDNRLVDGPGDDLRIFEIGRGYGGGGLAEAQDILVEVDGEFVLVGQVPGDESAFDLAGQVGDAEIAVLRICDAVGGSTGAPSPGPDIDAIAALNWIPA